MMKTSFLLFVLLQVTLQIAGVKVDYKNHKVYSVVPKTSQQVEALTDLSEQAGIILWSDYITEDNDVRVMVAPDKDGEFVEYVKAIGLEAKLRIPDVQRLIDSQLSAAANATRFSRNTIGSFNWNNYHTLSEIHAWLDELAVAYPNVVETIVIGHSNQGRDIKGVIINFRPDREARPLTGMIEGGIHAREWISPATVTYVINEFLTSTDDRVRFLAETFVWHIFPVVNPDGYVYTFTNDRLWRKNRNDAYNTTCGEISDDLSNGIDLNRNFDFNWNGAGFAFDPCSQTFAGPHPSSEPETRAILNYVLYLKDHGNMVYYYAFHSYSQMILVPFSHVSGAGVLEVDNYADLFEIAIRGAAKLSERHGTQYIAGPSAVILYGVNGSSFDWVKGVADIPIVFLFELRDLGDFGFLLPQEQIIPNCEEIMDSLLEMDRVTRLLGYYSGTSSIISSFLLLFICAVLILVN